MVRLNSFLSKIIKATKDSFSAILPALSGPRFENSLAEV
jgi:hypothetical protein